MSFYYPAFSYISDITLGVKTVTSFPAAHDFTLGEVVSFRISKANGTVQLNNVEVPVVAEDEFTITVDIDSRNFTPFIPTSVPVANPAMVVPAGSGIVPNSSLAQTNLVDSFDNIPVN